MMNNQNPHGMAPHKLILKEGAVVMLLRNLSIRLGLCNGTRLTVMGWTQSHRLIQCRVLTGARKNDIVLLPRINLQSLDTDPIQFSRKQFPIKLSFAMTIHKCQGQTFQRVGIILTNPLFTHGQLYVALSRCRSKDNLKVQLSYHKTKEMKTKNIVFRQIFD
jgi:ATP-dependent DNA helicase PIF1